MRRNVRCGIRLLSTVFTRRQMRLRTGILAQCGRRLCPFGRVSYNDQLYNNNDRAVHHYTMYVQRLESRRAHCNALACAPNEHWDDDGCEDVCIGQNATKHDCTYDGKCVCDDGYALDKEFYECVPRHECTGENVTTTTRSSTTTQC